LSKDIQSRLSVLSCLKASVCVIYLIKPVLPEILIKICFTSNTRIENGIKKNHFAAIESF